MEYTSRSEIETRQIANRILEEALRRGARPVVLALYGELGAGKTTFVKKLAEAVGIKDEIRSPTFLIVREFDIGPPGGGLERLIHIDAYRIDSSQELIDLGLEKILQDPKNLVVIEWAERAEELLPPSATRIRFEIIGEHERKLFVNS